MTIKDIDSELSKLRSCVVELQCEYLLPYIGGGLGTPSNRQILDIRAFCVLSHAAFENYAEELSMALMIESVHQFEYHKKISLSLLTLIHFHADSKSIDKISQRQYDYIKEISNNAKRRFSEHVNNNHGVNKKYLDSLFIPLGIDITTDSLLLGSLKTLADNRGDSAHKNPKRTSTIPDPENIGKIADDVMKIMGELSKSVKNINFYPWKQNI